MVFQNDGQSRRGLRVKEVGACKEKQQSTAKTETGANTNIALAKYKLDNLSNYPLRYGVSQAYVKTA